MGGWGGVGGDTRYKKNRGKETERNLLFCPVKAEVLFLVSLRKESFAILSSRWRWGGEGGEHEP